MANFGDNMREFVKNNNNSKKEIIPRLIVEQELEKLAEHLTTSTPKGQIRYELVKYERFKQKIAWKVHKSSSNILLCSRIHQIAQEKSLFFYFPHSSAELRYMKFHGNDRLLFYANAIEQNQNCLRDLVEYWFEDSILPAFKRSIKIVCSKGNYRNSYSFHFYFNFLLDVIASYEITTTDADELETIFSELCAKNGISLVNFNFKYTQAMLSL